MEEDASELSRPSLEVGEEGAAHDSVPTANKQNFAFKAATVAFPSSSSSKVEPFPIDLLERPPPAPPLPDVSFNSNLLAP